MVHSAESDPFHDESLPGYGNTAVIGTTHNGVISIASALSSSATNLFRAGYNQNNAGFFCNHAAFDALAGRRQLRQRLATSTFPTSSTATTSAASTSATAMARPASAPLSSSPIPSPSPRDVTPSSSVANSAASKTAATITSSPATSLSLNNYLHLRSTPAYTFTGYPNRPAVTFEDLHLGRAGLRRKPLRISVLHCQRHSPQHRPHSLRPARVGHLCPRHLQGNAPLHRHPRSAIRLQWRSL